MKNVIYLRETNRYDPNVLGKNTIYVVKDWHKSVTLQSLLDKGYEWVQCENYDDKFPLIMEKKGDE